MEDHIGEAGETFGYLEDNLRTHPGKILVGENNPGIKIVPNGVESDVPEDGFDTESDDEQVSNHHIVVQKMEGLGLATRSAELHSPVQGRVEDRKRQYYVGADAEGLCNNNGWLAGQSRESRWQHVDNRVKDAISLALRYGLISTSSTTLKDFILPPTHQAVKDFEMKCVEKTMMRASRENVEGGQTLSQTKALHDKS